MTSQNAKVYELISAGTPPVLLAEVKTYLGISTTTSDAFLQTLLDAATAWGQLYTSKEFSNNTYTLLLDCFENPIDISRAPINTITTIEYLIDGSFEVVDSSFYWLKKGRYNYQVILNEDASWPETDAREQAIKITFVTKPIDAGKLSIAKRAILQHVSYMFSNRGDCDDCDSCALSSGSVSIYDILKTPRI